MSSESGTNIQDPQDKAEEMPDTLRIRQKKCLIPSESGTNV
jgi:hypothetical protein